MRTGNSVYTKLGTTIFESMSRLATELGAVNLGQGFPDDPGAEDVRAAAANAVVNGWNQYPPMMGLPVLRQAIAAHEKRFYGLDYEATSETMVTSGATEAIASTIFGLVEPGDEVIILEPAYDAYAPLVRRAGGTCKFVRLHPPEWKLDERELAAAMGEKTKLVILNNPQNPAGKVWSEAELSLLASYVEKHDSLVLSDEVYEHVVFSGARHLPFPTLPKMRERTVKVGSGGKTFSLTGWKVGLIVAPKQLMLPVSRAHQFLTFTTPPNLQTAIAFGLGKPDEYFTELARETQRRRDRLAVGLQKLGFTTLPADGSWFLNIDIRSVGFAGTDVEFARKLVEEVGVASIPISAFYDSAPETHLVRLCFCKQDQILDAALERLGRHFGPGRAGI